MAGLLVRGSAKAFNDLRSTLMAIRVFLNHHVKLTSFLPFTDISYPHHPYTL